MNEVFSNRELSLLIWLVVVIIVILLSKKTHEPLLQLFKLFFKRTIFTVFSGLTLFTALIVFLAYKIHLWELTSLKDTLFWFCTFAVVTFFKANTIKDSKYFQKILKESIGFTVLLEFITNLYTFSLLIEVVMFPFIVFIVLTKAVSETKKEYEKVKNILTNLLVFIGFSFFIFSLVKSIVDYQKFFSLTNLNALLLPIILTIVSIPFFYLLALYINYEELLIRIDCMFNDKTIKKNLKKAIFINVRLSLDKVMFIRRSLKKFDIYNSADLNIYIKSLINSKEI